MTQPDYELDVRPILAEGGDPFRRHHGGGSRR